MLPSGLRPNIALKRKSSTKSKKCKIKPRLKSNNLYICDLYRKSQLGPDNDERHFDDVKRYYEALYDIIEMKEIMQLVATANKLTIAFDFNHDSVSNIDPANPSAADGRTYGTSERILIAANRDGLEVLGTLAHEMAHLAMYLIYSNGCLPYHFDDDIKRKKFETVVEICRELQTKNETIEKVYKNNVYNADEIPKELIVRVPQLFVLLRNNPVELEKQRKIFEELFEFWENCVVPDLKFEAALIEPRREVREMNKKLSIFEMLVSKEQMFDSQAEWLVEINKETGDTFIETTLPELTMSSLVANLRDSVAEDVVLSKNIFVKVHQLCNHKENLSKIALSSSYNLNSTFYILDSENYNLSSCYDLLHQLIAEVRTVFVTNRPWKDFEEEFSSLQHKCIKLQWKDLNYKKQNELLDTAFDFQGERVKLKDIWAEDSINLQNMPIEDFDKVNEKIIEFTKHLPSNQSDLLVERSFKPFTGSHQRSILSADDVIRKLKADRCVILADLAGMGKTTSAIQFAKSLKQQNPMSWVVFVGLKKQTEVYIYNKQEQPLNIGLEYIGQKLLNLETNFNQKLFAELSKKSKVVFVIDGYDEISPKFNEFMLTLFRRILDSGNFLLVTTRTHLVSDLENRLERSAIRLEPFKQTDQISFLTKFWENKLPGTTVDLKFKAKNLLKKFSSTLTHQDFVEVPLQLYMIAEVYGDMMTSEQISLNLFSLYKEFVSKKIDIWDGKGLLAKTDSKEIQKGSVTVGTMHQNIAVTSVFGAVEAKAVGVCVTDVKSSRELVSN